MELHEALRQAVAKTGIAPTPGPAATTEHTRAARKNYAERLSGEVAVVIAEQLRDLGLPVALPRPGPDKQFMGGYATKGVDIYLADEKHGLLLSSGIKGIPYSVAKNMRNRYRDLAVEALELHKRFPYAVCGHFLFIGRYEAEHVVARRRGAMLVETTALEGLSMLLSAISGRRRPDEPSELYEAIGVVLIEPGDPDSIMLSPPQLPSELHAAGYCERLVTCFERRNPFYR